MSAHDIQFEAYDVRGPKATKTAVLAVTSTAANADMSADSAIGADVKAGRMLRLQAEGCDVYYYWYKDGTLTIDDTATAGNGRCGAIPAGQFRDERPPFDVVGNENQVWPFLYVKAASGLSGKLRITVVSQDRGAVYG